MICDVSLEMYSDSKNYVRLQDDEITELGHTIKSARVTRQILATRFGEASCGNSVNSFDCRALSLFETVAGSQIITLRFYGMHELGELWCNEHALDYHRISWLIKLLYVVDVASSTGETISDNN